VKAKPKSTSVKKNGTTDEEATLDEVIEKIDQHLPALHRRANGAVHKKPPTDRLSKKARDVFKGMCDDPLLTDDGDDIRLVTKVNGAHP